MGAQNDFSGSIDRKAISELGFWLALEPGKPVERNRRRLDGMNEQQEPYNAGDAGQVGKRQKSQKTRDLVKKAALRKLMGDPEGRMWMWDLLGRCGAFHLSFSTDALVMAFNEGRRDVPRGGSKRLLRLHRS